MTVNDTDVCPAGMVTDAGTEISLVSLDTNATVTSDTDGVAIDTVADDVSPSVSRVSSMTKSIGPIESPSTIVNTDDVDVSDPAVAVTAIDSSPSTKLSAMMPARNATDDCPAGIVTLSVKPTAAPLTKMK